MEAEHGYSYGDTHRGMSTKRDSRGRYARDGYMPHYYRSHDGDMIAELHELMEEAPNNQIRQRFQSFISEIERMR